MGLTKQQWRLAALIAAVIAFEVYRDRISSQTLIFLAVFIPAVMFHEVSHGVVALWFGDDTAKRAGRLTLNPLAHIDPVGTLLLPGLLALTGVAPFGYAKPVPVNVSRLRKPRNQSVLVSLAGPGINVVLSLLAALVFRLLRPEGLTFATLNDEPAFIQAIVLFGVINIVLAVFNLIPVPPLDGSALLERLLPTRYLPQYYRLRPYTILLILALVFFARGGLTAITGPFVDAWARLLV